MDHDSCKARRWKFAVDFDHYKGGFPLGKITGDFRRKNIFDFHMHSFGLIIVKNKKTLIILSL